MRTLRAKAIGIVLLVLCVAQLSVLAFILWQDRIATTAQVGEQVSATAKMLGELYATQRTQNSQVAFRLANDAELIRALQTNSPHMIERLVQTRSPRESGDFVAVVDSNYQIISWVNGPGTALELAEFESLLQDTRPDDGSAVARIGGQAIGLSIRSQEGSKKPWRVIAGYSLQTALKERLESVSGSLVDIDLVAAGSVIVATDDKHRLVLPLDKTALGAVDAVMDLSESDLYTRHAELVKKLAAQALATFSLAIFLSALMFTRFFRRNIEQPLRDIRRQIHTLTEGEVQKSVAIDMPEPFRSLARDFERMRESVADRENRIMHHAEYDALTGLTNRSVVSEKLKMALARAKSNGTVVSALAIDLSRFSEINGSMGHEAGDAVLKEIARRLASNARITDSVARVGGDEFFVILEDSDVNLAQHLVKFMISSLMTPILINDSELKLNIHAGVAFYPQHCDSADALRRMANIALYTCKEDNASLVIYEAGQDEKHLRELAIIHDLPNAIKNNELYLQYQPKIEMETQQVMHVEALVRWRHPQLGFIPPDVFIALLEKAGLIHKLTDWVFKEAIKQSRAWKDAGFDLGIAVNISANDLADERLSERLNLLLHHYLVEPSKITIEVTESAVIKDPENSVKVLNAFRTAGIKCSLDDFGTGQTSLALLKQLPISEIKIDKSFVQNLRADSGDAIIVKSIIDLGHNMGLHVTAEGVESNYCWNLLNSYGCDLIQGYLVSAPLTADELGEWHLRLQDRHLNKLDLSFVHDMTA